MTRLSTRVRSRVSSRLSSRIRASGGDEEEGGGSGFDPTAYAGLRGYWLADNATRSGSDVTELDNAHGAASALAVLGDAPTYDATGWVDGSPAIELSTPSALYAATGLGGSLDSTTFVVVDSPETTATDYRPICFVGSWGDGTLGGLMHLRSYASGAVYRQNAGWVSEIETDVSGPAVWCFELRDAGGGQCDFEARRNGTLVASGTCDAVPMSALTLLGLTLDGSTASSGWFFVGKFKAALAYEGAMSGATRDEIIAGLTAAHGVA